MIELTMTTPCADCPHSRGAHYRTYDEGHVGCAACECDGFMLTPSKPRPPMAPDEMERLARVGMEIFRDVAAKYAPCRDLRLAAEDARDALTRAQLASMTALDPLPDTYGTAAARVEIDRAWKILNEALGA